MPLSVIDGPLFHQVRAADEKEEANRSFNPWRTGTDPVEPRIARDFFVRMSLPLAAEHELKVFVSNPFVYSHLVHLFFPEAKTSSRALSAAGADHGGGAVRSAQDGGGASQRRCPERCPPFLSWHSLRETLLTTALVLGHVIALPLLLVVPRWMEIEIEERLRKAITDRRLPIGIVWFFPSGRFALWCLATAGLAALVTTLPAPPLASTDRSSGELPNLEGVPLLHSLAVVSPLGVLYSDLLLLSYALGWALGELSDLLTTASWWFYIRDIFNVVDILLVVGMLATLGTRLALTHGVVAGEAAQAIALPCQALTAWLAWLRLLQLLFIFPRTGPLLIMTIRMLEDLWQVMSL